MYIDCNTDILFCLSQMDRRLFEIERVDLTCYQFFCHFRIRVLVLKDARSVSLYPYNRSQILQYIKYTLYLINKHSKRSCKILWQIMYFWTKSKNTTTTKQKSTTSKPLQEPEIEHGTSCTKSGCANTAPPSQLTVSIVVKLFNCFDAMCRT